MEKQTVYILELDGVKSIHLDLGGLNDAIEMELDGLHEDDFETTVFKVYAKQMSEKEIDELPEFDGF